MKCKISDLVSQDLALRDSADRLFAHLASKRAKQAMIDFSNVRSMTRSFAHQYLLNKDKSAIVISEINVPASVKKMFSLVVKPIEMTSRAKTKAIPLRLML